MEDSMATHDERQWPGLDCAMALSATCDVAIPEPKEEEVSPFPADLVGSSWGWSCIAPEMSQAVGAVNWCPRRRGHQSGRPRHERRCCTQASTTRPRTRDRRPTSGRRRPTSTSSVTATTRTPATSEDGDGDGNDGQATFF
ncbi:hypothetical protein D1007_55337 [Hordeum vulgare]|nr:hypothetical protein D1007_55337 [Hordeum vulgare]